MSESRSLASAEMRVVGFRNDASAYGPALSSIGVDEVGRIDRPAVRIEAARLDRLVPPESCHENSSAAAGMAAHAVATAAATNDVTFGGREWLDISELLGGLPTKVDVWLVSEATQHVPGSGMAPEHGTAA